MFIWFDQYMIMEALQKIKTKFFHRQLQQAVSAQAFRPKPVAFDKAQSVAILFDATDPGQRDEAVRYGQALQQKGKRVGYLAFIDDKQVYESLPFPYFNRKNLDWKEVPSGEEVQNFLSREWDALFFLTNSAPPPLHYVAALAKSHLKIGPAGDASPYLDLMIDFPNDRFDIPGFTQQAERLLQKLQMKHERIFL